MLLYIIPLVIFVLLSYGLYYMNEKKEDVILKNVLPSVVVSVIVFFIIKYNPSFTAGSEPLMGGNYFD